MWNSADWALVLSQINVPVCFTAASVATVAISIKRAVARSTERQQQLNHAYQLEQLRLTNMKEIEHRKSGNNS